MTAAAARRLESSGCPAAFIPNAECLLDTTPWGGFRLSFGPWRERVGRRNRRDPDRARNVSQLQELPPVPFLGWPLADRVVGRTGSWPGGSAWALPGASLNLPLRLAASPGRELCPVRCRACHWPGKERPFSAPRLWLGEVQALWAPTA